MIAPETLKVLQTAPLFQGVPVKLLALKLAESRLRTLNAGEALLVPGQTNNVIYVILSGRLNVQTKISGVKPMAVLGEAECVGETCLIGDPQISAYVIAATPCKLLAIDSAALWELIDISHQAAHDVLTVLSMRMRPASEAGSESLESHLGFSGSTMIDEMTGLYNRHWINEKIDRYLRRQVYSKQPSSLMIVAIDGFGELAESCGQLGSEQVLRHLSYTMLSCLHPGDHAAHYQGEQFVVFMPDTSLSDGCIAAERLRVAIGESVVVLPSGDALPPISISIGASCAAIDDLPASLLARADAALQQAQASGGNCVKYQV